MTKSVCPPTRFQTDVLANSPGTFGVKAWLAAIFHPSCRAVTLIRLASKSRGVTYWIARNLLISLHSIDVGKGAEVGPGLTLPHPFGIVIGKGVRIGSSVTVYHLVTLGGKRGGYPIVEDGVTIYPGATVVGEIKLGAACTIGANAFVDVNVACRQISVGRQKMD